MSERLLVKVNQLWSMGWDGIARSDVPPPHRAMTAVMPAAAAVLASLYFLTGERETCRGTESLKQVRYHTTNSCQLSMNSMALSLFCLV